MKRRFIIQNTVTGEELILPVTPSEYTVESGRGVTVVSMAQYGEVAVPALRSLMDQSISGFFPARKYEFCDPTTVTDPKHYIDLLTRWSNAGNVCLLIISGTGVCEPILLKPLQYTESGGNNDVSYKLSFTGYRAVAASDSYDTATGNCTRSESSAYTAAASTYLYTVRKYDTWKSICRGAYGNESLADALMKYNKYKFGVGVKISIPPETLLS